MFSRLFLPAFFYPHFIFTTFLFLPSFLFLPLFLNHSRTRFCPSNSKILNRDQTRHSSPAHPRSHKHPLQSSASAHLRESTHLRASAHIRYRLKQHVWRILLPREQRNAAVHQMDAGGARARGSLGPEPRCSRPCSFQYTGHAARRVRPFLP